MPSRSKTKTLRYNCEYPDCGNKAVSKVSLSQEVTVCATCGRETAEFIDEYRCAEHGGVA